jgi:hypothetical protein
MFIFLLFFIGEVCRLAKGILFIKYEFVLLVEFLSVEFKSESGKVILLPVFISSGFLDILVSVFSLFVLFEFIDSFELLLLLVSVFEFSTL